MRNKILNLLPSIGKQAFSGLTITLLLVVQNIMAHNVDYIGICDISV
ncbi:hypothetical protein [Bacteroides xylanisolvens]|jgi:hypothetical protein